MIMEYNSIFLNKNFNKMSISLFFNSERVIVDNESIFLYKNINKMFFFLFFFSLNSEIFF
jgi:hypothetical protein